jgi:hypothetical protein
MVAWPPALQQSIMTARACGRRAVTNRAARGTGTAQAQHTLKDFTLLTYLLQLGPSSKVSTKFQSSATNWGPSIEHLSLWGTFHIQNTAHPPSGFEFLVG